MDYQNNSYLQQYVSNNMPLIFEQIIGLALLGSGSAFLAYKASTASPSGKLERASRRIRGLSPIIAVIIALVLWLAVFSPFYVGSLTTPDVFIYLVLCLITISIIVY